LGEVIRAWQIGGAALALLVLGGIAILAAFGLAIKGLVLLPVIFLIAGFSPIALIGYKIYFETVRPALEVTKKIAANTELLNAVQEAALQTATIARDFSDYALTHANEIVTGIDQAKFALNLAPRAVAEKVLNLAYFKQGDEFARGIRIVANRIHDVVGDVREGIDKADAGRLLPHLTQLRELAILVKKELFND
jgi:hypothetical protein